MISGTTQLIAHLGYPTESFKAPMIYNPWFEKRGIDAVVVPMGVKPGDYAGTLAALARVTNLKGALVTMPHKVTTLSLADEITPGDQFDGSGFVRGILRKGRTLRGARVIVSGAGGVGSAIAASLAAEGVAHISLYDTCAASAEGLAERLRAHYPQLVVQTGSNDPAGFDVVVNATPLGMKEGDPLPFDVTRIDPAAMVGEVVMKTEYTPLLQAALAKGCGVQVGTDMLFEMIPAYLEFFGYGTATADELRAVAQIKY